MVADSEGTETEETSPAGEPPNKSKLIKIEVSTVLLSIFGALCQHLNQIEKVKLRT